MCQHLNNRDGDRRSDDNAEGNTLADCSDCCDARSTTLLYGGSILAVLVPNEVSVDHRSDPSESWACHVGWRRFLSISSPRLDHVTSPVMSETLILTFGSRRVLVFCEQCSKYSVSHPRHPPAVFLQVLLWRYPRISSHSHVPLLLH